MSLPFYTITCSNCDFKGGYNYGTHFKFEGLPDHKPLLRRVWCRDCDKITNACFPFREEDAKTMISDLNDQIERNKSGFLASLSRSKKSAIQEANFEIEAINRRVNYFNSITYNNRCLDCGGKQLFPFDLSGRGYNEPEPMKIEHLCGGQLMISTAGRINFAVRPKVIYDENGIIVLDERIRSEAIPNETKSDKQKDHELGINVVCQQLKNDGCKIERIQIEIGKFPQIVANIHGRLTFIAVLTTRYPKEAKLEESIRNRFKVMPFRTTLIALLLRLDYGRLTQ